MPAAQRSPRLRGHSSRWGAVMRCCTVAAPIGQPRGPTAPFCVRLTAELCPRISPRPRLSPCGRSLTRCEPFASAPRRALWRTVFSRSAAPSVGLRPTPSPATAQARTTEKTTVPTWSRRTTSSPPARARRSTAPTPKGLSRTAWIACRGAGATRKACRRSSPRHRWLGRTLGDGSHH